MKPKPINGFSRKLHLYQILSYIFFLLLIFSYYFITFCLSSTAAKVVGGTLEGIFAIIVIVSGAMTTAIDPTDSYLVETNKAKAENKPYMAPIKDFYCNVDMSFVHESSKHCKRCNRCTEEFDHHCKWVNNDIGKKNYKAFFVLIFSVMCFLIVYLVMAILLTVNYGNDSQLFDNDIFLYENRTHQIRAAMITLWIILGISLVFLILDTNLVLFHMFLIHKGLTTFQYIVLAEERRDYKREMERARRIMGEQQRTCLDFVLCLNRKKKKAVDRTRPNMDENAVDGVTAGGPGIQFNKNQAVITELQNMPGSNLMDQEAIQATHHDEHGEYLRNSEGAMIIHRNLEKNVGSIAEDTKAKDMRNDLVGTMDTLNTKKRYGDQDDENKAKSPYSASVNEFGDVTALNNSRNINALHKSLHFESLKTFDDRKGDTQHISVHIVDDVLPQNIAERNLPNPLHSAHCLDLEGKNLLKFGRYSAKDVSIDRKIIASNELKKEELWRDSKDHEEASSIIKSVKKDRSFHGVEAVNA